MKCWPGFQLIGVEKCGTSHVFNMLNRHQHVLAPTKGVYPNHTLVKEPLWYNGVWGK